MLFRQSAASAPFSHTMTKVDPVIDGACVLQSLVESFFVLLEVISQVHCPCSFFGCSIRQIRPGFHQYRYSLHFPINLVAMQNDQNWKEERYGPNSCNTTLIRLLNKLYIYLIDSLFWCSIILKRYFLFRTSRRLQQQWWWIGRLQLYFLVKCKRTEHCVNFALLMYWGRLESLSFWGTARADIRRRSVLSPPI